MMLRRVRMMGANVAATAERYPVAHIKPHVNVIFPRQDMMCLQTTAPLAALLTRELVAAKYLSTPRTIHGRVWASVKTAIPTRMILAFHPVVPALRFTELPAAALYLTRLRPERLAALLARSIRFAAQRLSEYGTWPRAISTATGANLKRHHGHALAANRTLALLSIANGERFTHTRTRTVPTDTMRSRPVVGSEHRATVLTGDINQRGILAGHGSDLSHVVPGVLAHRPVSLFTSQIVPRGGVS